VRRQSEAATALWMTGGPDAFERSKAPSPLRSAGALQNQNAVATIKQNLAAKTEEC
jgi:hypothetical protein